MVLQNISSHTDYTELCARRWQLSYSALFVGISFSVRFLFLFKILLAQLSIVKVISYSWICFGYNIWLTKIMALCNTT
jgi:hypothetical protein